MIWLSYRGAVLGQETLEPNANPKRLVHDALVLIPHNQYFMIMQSRNGIVLTVNKQDTCTFDMLTNATNQLFELQLKKNKVGIKSVANGNYVALENGKTVCNSINPVLWEIVIVPMALEAHTGNIMQNVFWFETAEALNANTKDWEQMYVCQVENGVKFLSRWNDRFLHVLDNGKCVFYKNSQHEREVFQIVPMPNGDIQIKSVFNGKWMTTDPNRKIWCVNEHPDYQSLWKLRWLDDNQILTSRQLQTYSIVLSTASAFAALLPFAIMGVVAAVGFGVEGVVAGSLAAGIQSGIGNVAAGSAFATFTSIGMVGLPAIGTAGAVAGGAALGAGIGTGTAQLVDGEAANQGELAIGTQSPNNEPQA